MRYRVIYFQCLCYLALPLCTVSVHLTRCALLFATVDVRPTSLRPVHRTERLHAWWQRSSPSRGYVSDIRYLSFKRVHPRQKLSPGGRQKPSKVGNDASRRPCRRRHRSVLPIVSSRILMTRLTRRQRRKKTRPVWRLPTLTQWRKSGGKSGDAGADPEGSVAVVKVRGARGLSPPASTLPPPAKNHNVCCRINKF